MPVLSTAVQSAEAEVAGGNLTRARDLLVDAVDEARAALGPDHLDVLAAQTRLAALHRELGSLPEARRLLESALEIGHRTYGVAHPQLLAASYELAVLAHELGNAYEAGRNFRILSEHGTHVLGADHPHVLAARRYLGEDVPGEFDAPPPLPLPPTGPTTPGEFILESTPAPARNRRFPIVAGIAGLALIALVATLIGVWAIPGKEPDKTQDVPPAQAGPQATAQPAASASASASASGSPSAGGSEPGLAVPGGAATGTAGGKPPTKTTPPAAAGTTISGRYQVKFTHTGLCLGQGPELFKNTGRTVLGQHTCGSSLPQFTIEPVAANVYRIVISGGSSNGCADVDYAGTTEGLLLAAQACNGAADQKFTLEAVTSPAVGYRLHSVAGARFCIGVLEQRSQNGVQIMQDTCRGSKAEVFTLEKR